MRPGLVGSMCWRGRAVIAVVRSNAGLGVAVKGFVDMANFCSQVAGKGGHHAPSCGGPHLLH